MTDATQTPPVSQNETPAAAATDTTVKADALTSIATPEVKAPEANADAPKENKEGEKPVEDKAAKEAEGEKKEEVKAPESYTDFKLPEGVKVDDEFTGEFKTVAKDLQLPQEAAQKIVDLGAKFADKWGKQAAQMIKDTQAKWVGDLKKDSALGGEKLAENLSVAQKGLNAYDKDGKLNALLKETGLNNHVDLIRVFHQIGSTLKEDSLVNPNSGGSAQPTTGPGSLEAAASVIYGKRN